MARGKKKPGSRGNSQGGHGDPNPRRDDGRIEQTSAGVRNGRAAAPNNRVVRRRQPLCRLFCLRQHLILHCFDYLDNAGRKSAFAVMGWGMENHERRKALIRKRQQELEAMKKAKEEERIKMESEKQEGKKAEGNQSDATEAPEKLNSKFMGQLTLCQKVTSPNVSGDNDQLGSKDSQKEPPAEKGKSLKTNATSSDISSSDIAMKEILPPLYAPVDPDTLLSRLNTRRLCKRVNHFRREQRRKKEIQAAESASINTEDGKAGHSVVQFFDTELLENIEYNRLYPKNVTIEDMSDLEWDNLLDMATLRNSGEMIPYDPIPTQHELLLFSPCPDAVVVLASYPRSGNSLIRTLYEHTTLRVTGSDMQGGLAKHDLVGEMAVGKNKVQFVKTHFPERRGSPQFLSKKVVLLVRNPYDAIESFFNLMMTGSHTTSVTEEIREKTQKVWEEFVLKEAKVWAKFHEYWFNQNIPILLVRYEDLIRKPDKVTERVVQFVLDIQRMGTFFGQRIDRCIREYLEIDQLGSYKPRSGGIGKSMSRYSPELRKKMEDHDLTAVMDSLGYGDMIHTPPDQWENITPLQDYAIEYENPPHIPKSQAIVILNKGNLVRTEASFIPWNKIKAELGFIDEPCNCESCRLESGQ